MDVFLKLWNFSKLQITNFTAFKYCFLNTLLLSTLNDVKKRASKLKNHRNIIYLEQVRSITKQAMFQGEKWLFFEETKRRTSYSDVRIESP